MPRVFWGSLLATRQRKNSRFSGFIIPLFSTLVLSYFIYHAQTGRYSIHVMRAMDEKAVVLRYELSNIKKSRTQLHERVALLSDGTLEADALDERARDVLGLAGVNELIILYE